MAPATSWLPSHASVAGTRLQVAVEVNGTPLPATEATALTAEFLDAAKAWERAQRGEAPDTALTYTSVTQNHVAVMSHMAYCPFTVLEDTLHAHWLLRGGAFTPGLDDADLRAFR